MHHERNSSEDHTSNRPGAALTITVGIAGCSSSSESAPKTIEFVLSGDAAQGGAFATMAERYTEETGVQVDVVELPYDDMITRLRSAAQANDLPALARVGNVDPVWSEQLLDLTSVTESSPFMQNLLVADTEGAYTALPTDLTDVGLFLNTSLFEQAGVAYPGPDDEPWSWDEFVASLETVLDSTDAKYGMVMDPSSHRLSAMLYQFGSNGFHRDGDEYSTNDDTATALEYFGTLNDDRIMPRSVWLSGDDANALFKSGQVAAYYSGVWQVTDFTQNIADFEWLPVKMPAQPVQATNLGTNYLVGFDGSGVEKETQDFITWLYSPENYAELCEIAGFLPVLEGVDVSYGDSQALFDVFNQEIIDSDPISSQSMNDGLSDAYKGIFSESDFVKEETIAMLAGEQTADETVAAILADLQAGLK